MSGIESTPRPPNERTQLRAETPPPHFWRRWTGDAPAEDAPEPATAAAPAPPIPGPQTTAAPSAADTGATMSPPATDRNGGADGGNVAPYRVLIIEDDRGQALFAQSVLHGAGMQAEVQTDPAHALEAIERYSPDLVLMDLHMPGNDGMVLTQQLRKRPEYLHMPIVFLTGDPDPERQFEVLESGADDFLTKPIRPRHLIAAVSNRILRARQRAPVAAPAPTINPETGLHVRSHVFQRLNALLEAHRGSDEVAGGVYFVEVGGAPGLRERFGYSRFEQLMIQAGQRLAQAAAPHLLARLNDNSFLCLAEGIAAEQLEPLATGLRDSLGHAAFELPGEDQPLRLRGVIGYAALPYGFADGGSALEAVERAALDARQQTSDIAAYMPAVADEDQDKVSLEDASLELAFQPIVSVAGSDLAQYQVLLRMRQDDGHLLTAAEAVPAAEFAGRIVELDQQVLERVLELLAQRKDQTPPLRLFVSQSPRTLARDGVADWLLKGIAERGIDPSSLVIDLRLADALIHTVTLREFCQRLMAAGVQFCLSQFEPGAEAESLLAQLPLGFLRLANRYAQAHADPALHDQLRNIIELAHRHSLQVIGQHIEDPQAAAAMWLGGVDFIQGNLVQGVGSELSFDFYNAVL
ncbi:response regulator receiver protein [Pseudoxanthomonas kalamensis DSM 18571]|uniref:EAL domain-containing protein n=1 Tax=Pseudoxanthomonas kalamensis TaxID=289483 RepID=UPI0013914D47|nr:EAL domain-containing protein [Pseudoxanthomonas kalamensis]KAF1712612.1 response regulator receiver protein [Pseudoxanthomonas kalamensis DSM 18571]